MGRKKLNRTDEERRKLNCERRMQYYWKHVIDERKKGDFYFIKNKEYKDKPDLLPYEEALLNAFFN